MLAGFMLIAILLGSAAVRSWLVVERFAEHSRRGNEQALQLTESIHELAERTVDIERSARQYLVLKDPALLARFDDHLMQSLAAVTRLEASSAKGLQPQLRQWRESAARLNQVVRQQSRQSELAPALAALNALNGGLAEAGRRWIDEQNGRMLLALEENRLQLAGQVLGAAAGALIVALAMGWWLARPVRKLEKTIERLGESRFDEAVVVNGPADLRRVGRRLDWLRQRLGELEADRQRTLRHVSHELKTPLTALREGIALLQEQVVGRLGAEQREVVDILQHNVMTLQGQIESLLNLNSAAFGARHLRRRMLPVQPLLAEAIRRRELQIQARQLVVKVEGRNSSARLDEEKMLVVLDNLLSNAIDFSPEGGQIRLIANESGGLFQIDVIDQGPGVAGEDAERIFQPFVQGSRAAPAERQGSGVGLSIVRELVGAMDGQILLLPSDKGAHFRVEIPTERYPER